MTSFYIYDENPQFKKFYIKDIFPSLKEEFLINDPYIQKDDMGYYTLFPVWPEIYVSDYGKTVFDILEYNRSSTGSFSVEQLPKLRQKIIYYLNSKNNNVKDYKGEWDDSCFKLKDDLQKLLEIISKAMQENKPVNWS